MTSHDDVIRESEVTEGGGGGVALELRSDVVKHGDDVSKVSIQNSDLDLGYRNTPRDVCNHGDTDSARIGEQQSNMISETSAGMDDEYLQEQGHISFLSNIEESDSLLPSPSGSFLPAGVASSSLSNTGNSVGRASTFQQHVPKVSHLSSRNIRNTSDFQQISRNTSNAPQTQSTPSPSQGGYDSTTSPAMSTSNTSDMEYPLRAAIPPLTNKTAVKRSIGPVDEVNMVYRRPTNMADAREHRNRSASPQVAALTERRLRSTSPHMTSSTVTSSNMASYQANKSSALSRTAYMAPKDLQYMSPYRPPSGHHLTSGGFTSGFPPRAQSETREVVVPARRSLSSGERSVGSAEAGSGRDTSTVLGVGMAAEARVHQSGGQGHYCHQCQGVLVDLKRQALRGMFPDTGDGMAEVSQTGIL